MKKGRKETKQKREKGKNKNKEGGEIDVRKVEERGY